MAVGVCDFLVRNAFLTKVRRLISSLLLRWERARGRKIFFFYLPLEGQLPCIAPLLETLRKQGGPVSIFLARACCVRHRNLAALGLTRFRILDAEFAPRTYCDVLISPTQWLPEWPGATVRVCIFHGQPSKGNTFLPHLLKQFQALFLLGPLQKDLYEKFASEHPTLAQNLQTFDVGYPKSDALLAGRYSRNAVLQELGLEPERAVVLYAPAFDHGASLDRFGEDIVNELLNSKWSVIVKLHPVLMDPLERKPFGKGIDWATVFAKFENNRRFRLYRPHAIDPVLAAADVMLTDFSGVALEFVALDKPVVYLDCPEFFNRTIAAEGYGADPAWVRDDPRANAGRNAGQIVRELSDLLPALERALGYPEELAKKRSALRSRLLFNAGCALPVAVDRLRQLAGLRSPEHRESR